MVAVLTMLGSAALASPHHAKRAPVIPVPQFAFHPLPATFPDADLAGEPSVGVDWRTGAVLYQAGFGTYKLLGGAWSDVTSLYTAFNIDPILATDSTSGVTLAGGDDGSCSVLAETSDDGQSWRPSLPCTGTPDHPTVGIGPAVGSSRQDNKRMAYYCQQYPVVEECNASSDDGQTWLPAVPVTGCAGLFGHVKISADGTAYLPVRLCSDAQGDTRTGGAVSSDNGLTWDGYVIPDAALPSHGFDPSIATTPDNTVYETWSRDSDFRPLIAWSHDHGQTWSHAVDISAGSRYPIYAATFQAAIAGDVGRVAVAYLAADRPAVGGITPFDPGYVGAWYLYVSSTYDAGAHWTTARVQDSPVQLGPICDNGTTCLSGRNLLDFMDASVTADGRIVIGYANGCHPDGCPADPAQVAQSVNAWGVVAVQSTGLSLFSRYGRLAG